MGGRSEWQFSDDLSAAALFHPITSKWKACPGIEMRMKAVSMT